MAPLAPWQAGVVLVEALWSGVVALVVLGQHSMQGLRSWIQALVGYECCVLVEAQSVCAVDLLVVEAQFVCAAVLLVEEVQFLCEVVQSVDVSEPGHELKGDAFRASLGCGCCH